MKLNECCENDFQIFFQDAKFYSLSTKFDESFSNKNKDLVIQFSVKHEQDIDCGGGYVKVIVITLPLNRAKYPYKIIFQKKICFQKSLPYAYSVLSLYLCTYMLIQNTLDINLS